jgi:hypothetical protein
VYVVLDGVGPQPFHPGVKSKSRRAQSPLADDLRAKLAKAEDKARDLFDKLAALVLVPVRDNVAIDKAARACREAQIAEAQAAQALDDFLDTHRDEVIVEAEARRDEARAVARAQADQLAACLDAVADADSLVKAVADRNKPRGNGAMTADTRKRLRPGGDAITRVMAYLDPPREVIRVTPDAYRRLQLGEAVEDIEGRPVAELTGAVRVVYGQPLPRPGV